MAKESAERRERTALHYRCPKTMHVSPFMDMNLDYEFVLTRADREAGGAYEYHRARRGIRDHPTFL